MGLDINVVKTDSWKKKRENEEAYTERKNALVKAAGVDIGLGFDDSKLTPIQKERLDEKILDLQQELQIGDYDSYEVHEEVHLSASPHPDHMYNMTYFRSSYNSSGFNNVAEARGMPTLYDIFGPVEAYEFQPDWDAAYERAKEAVEKWRALEESPEAMCFVQEVTSDLEPQELNEERSITVTSEFLAKGMNGTWHCKDGVFSDEGHILCGVIMGTRKLYSGKIVPAVHVVLKPKNGENQITWYRQAAEIVLASITQIVNHPEKEGFYLQWSS